MYITPADIELTLDPVALARMLGVRAMASRRGEATLARGLIKATVRNRRHKKDL